MYSNALDSYSVLAPGLAKVRMKPGKCEVMYLRCMISPGVQGIHEAVLGGLPLQVGFVRT